MNCAIKSKPRPLGTSRRPRPARASFRPQAEISDKEPAALRPGELLVNADASMAALLLDDFSCLSYNKKRETPRGNTIEASGIPLGWTTGCEPGESSPIFFPCNKGQVRSVHGFRSYFSLSIFPGLKRVAH